jgi:hypothetical protein
MAEIPVLTMPSTTEPVLIRRAQALAGAVDGDPPVIARVQHNELLLDPRTVSETEISELGAAVRAAMA